MIKDTHAPTVWARYYLHVDDANPKGYKKLKGMMEFRQALKDGADTNGFLRVADASVSNQKTRNLL